MVLMSCESVPRKCEGATRSGSDVRLPKVRWLAALVDLSLGVLGWDDFEQLVASWHANDFSVGQRPCSALAGPTGWVGTARPELDLGFNGATLSSSALPDLLWVRLHAAHCSPAITGQRPSLAAPRHPGTRHPVISTYWEFSEKIPLLSSAPHRATTVAHPHLPTDNRTPRSLQPFPGVLCPTCRQQPYAVLSQLLAFLHANGPGPTALQVLSDSDLLIYGGLTQEASATVWRGRRQVQHIHSSGLCVPAVATMSTALYPPPSFLTCTLLNSSCRGAAAAPHGPWPSGLTKLTCLSSNQYARAHLTLCCRQQDAAGTRLFYQNPPPPSPPPVRDKTIHLQASLNILCSPWKAAAAGTHQQPPDPPRSHRGHTPFRAFTSRLCVHLLIVLVELL